MVRRLSSFCAAWIVDNSDKSKCSETAIAYGLEIIFTSIFGVALMVLISLVWSRPLSWVYFLLGFAPLHSTAGGFHAHSHLGCFVVSTLMFVSGMVISYLLELNSIAYLIISLISFVLVLALSPVEAKNKKLTAIQFKRNRTMSLFFSGFFVVLACIFCMMGIVEAGISVFFSGILFASISLLIAKIRLK